ncbi:MAG TPA: polysaccharide deacetylase family protein [Bryobacteraceae bacterium]|nr:polysaccharide deacetylase family protein [Bryobacteraceae bacterium]
MDAPQSRTPTSARLFFVLPATLTPAADMDLVRVLETALGVAGVSAGALGYAVRVPSSSWIAPSVHRGTVVRPAIALTFDDGPSESTPELLEILASYGAPATFFECGANVRRLPGVARQVAEAGHEIGNHSDTHPLLALKSADFIDRELSVAQEAIEDATGHSPRYFRAPYGVRWFGLRAAQQRLDLTGVTWSAIALDWKRQTPAVVSRLLKGAVNGAILCLHDGRVLEHHPDIGVTLQAVRELLPRLIEQGFHFEKVTDILCPTKN